MSVSSWNGMRLGAGVALAVLTTGCIGEPDVVFQVIEETTFAPSLNIDLDAMEILSSGLYWQDLEVGTGDRLEIGLNALVRYTGWLSDGTQFDMNDTGFSFLMGNNEVIRGWEEGMLGMRVGGSRRIVIPPSLAYAGQPRGLIPAGSILVFEVTLDGVA